MRVDDNDGRTRTKMAKGSEKIMSIFMGQAGRSASGQSECCEHARGKVLKKHYLAGYHAYQHVCKSHEILIELKIIGWLLTDTGRVRC